ncbi:FAD/NAD(P)-binding domain-containing protein [Karstenula rhodostoma CBS 690.94]|uniref:FAD/NAD(P)-binding domain-containing protein n=1 Tax=Karstenula rhodostoma CBS 690.94 TaxID=1392251 RepID=A0A9P4UEM7_9PLEO|nr:FAD/NAD(P)-binding domain-containing protein [Karstenula rhodostoma CBS 690.94]
MGSDAVIIGGSTAGLLNGVMLKHHGYNVTILEQFSGTRDGYDAGITIGPDVKSFLAKHDRVQRPFALTCTPPLKFNIQGKPRLEHKQTMVMTCWALFSKILRVNYDGTTSTAVPVAPEPSVTDGTVEYRSGARVTGVKDVGDRVEVHYEDTNSHVSTTISAGLVVVADGSTSSIRKLLAPDIERRYAGYICWRGTISESSIKNKEFNENYSTPTDDGDLDQGKRLYNWVWYMNLPENSSDIERLFTDVNGKQHQGTLPRGLVRPENWEKQKSLALSVLPPGLAEVVSKTTRPFLTRIYDVTSSKIIFFNSKLFVVGDAAMSIRPNVGMSTQLAAYDCNMLERVIEGKITPSQWEKVFLRYKYAQRRFGLTVAAYGLRSKFTAVWEGLKWLLLLLLQKVGIK